MGQRLARANRRFREIRDSLSGNFTAIPEGALEARHLATLGELMTAGASMRKESRGLHVRTDAVQRSEDWRKWLIVRSGSNGEPEWDYRDALMPAHAFNRS